MSLIEFTQQTARMRGKVISHISQHRQTAVYEYETQGLPGLRFNVLNSSTGDEIWLVVERLHERKPPQVVDDLLRPWLRLPVSPTDEPELLVSISGDLLIAAGTHRSTKVPPSKQKAELLAVDPEQTIELDSYENAARVRAAYEAYLEGEWTPWAREERARRRTIKIYSELFTLKQKLEGGIVETQLELVWGGGIAVWSTQGTTLTYPILGQLVDISIDPLTAAIQVRPRDVDVQLQIDWFASVDNPGVARLEVATKEFYAQGSSTFSPFDRGTYEPVLRTAAAALDPNGVYWPTETDAADRSLPKPDSKLKITDTWALFARPRSNNLFIQDLEKLRAQVAEADDSEDFPDAIRAVVSDPSNENESITLPSYRGVSGGQGIGPGPSGTAESVRDLYFPKPYNDEQVRIVQLLDVADGVVVQGPPGTGKTHTIANVICHYLAQGQRVLVTSMKDPALAVLQGQLPDQIRTLAVSLLSSEQEGMKQFEHTIQKIASEVQTIDPRAYAREIRYLDESIDGLHGKLARIDREIAAWAKQNLSKLTLDGEEIAPDVAAEEVASGEGQYEWLPDALGIDEKFAPRFTDEDIIRLRQARRELGPDIDYLSASLPQVVEFPTIAALLTLHQQLSQFATLRAKIEGGEIPAFPDTSLETLTSAEQLVQAFSKGRALRKEIDDARRVWTAELRNRLARSDEMLSILDVLGTEIEEVVVRRSAFIKRPVTAPDDLYRNADILSAISRMTEGKPAFGMVGWLGKSEQRRQINSIRVLGKPPATREDWVHVEEFLSLQNQLRELGLRWNAVAVELNIEVFDDAGPTSGMNAAKAYESYAKVKASVQLESQIATTAQRLFPTWPKVADLVRDTTRWDEIEGALRQNLTKVRLGIAWSERQRLLELIESRSGRIVDAIRECVAGMLGNPDVTTQSLQSKWIELTDELSRVNGLTSHLDCVREICAVVQESGAPQYAAALQKPQPSNAIDNLLPDHWRKAWRLRRLATHLDAVDQRDQFKALTTQRRDVEADLSRAYRDVVVKRTWLKLAENAVPSVRAALQAYLAAIQRIGKGTGKRASRFRQDARNAAAKANPAVPCWIMPHHRVSESLPPELGCFDLVIIDEASQSDLAALPSLLRAKKVLIVGDDKQVSPEGVGLEEEKIRNLMARFLGNQVETYRPQMSPDRSMYDLFKVVFAANTVMLKEHFRCVAPIIEYSKREFYQHEIRPLRIPRASERLDPPLVDVLVSEGYRQGDINLPEARCIVDEIKAIVGDPAMAKRSIGVVSLLADKQALKIWEMLTEEIGPETIQKHSITCGDARTFQGKERDIMFLSMVCSPGGDTGVLSRDAFGQRFNVAASRAKDRMYLVRSVDLEDLSPKDVYRRSLISHFSSPFNQGEQRVEDLRKLCESPFERAVYDELVQLGYYVTPQVRVGEYRIDLVVEGNNDARLAIECDGDRYHGPERWNDDMKRQRVLERAGWTFWRCFASAFARKRSDCLADLFKTLAEHGVEPLGGSRAPRSVHTEQRVYFMPDAVQTAAKQGDGLTPNVDTDAAE